MTNTPSPQCPDVELASKCQKQCVAVNKDCIEEYNNVKGVPNAQFSSLNFLFLVPSDRAGSDKFVHTGKSVKFGPVWQTEALQSRKISFS